MMLRTKPPITALIQIQSYKGTARLDDHFLALLCTAKQRRAIEATDLGTDTLIQLTSP